MENLPGLMPRVAIPHLHHPGGLSRKGGRCVWWGRDDLLPHSDLSKVLDTIQLIFLTFASPHTTEPHKGRAVVGPISPTAPGVAA